MAEHDREQIAEQEAEASRHALEQGGLPLEAQRRLSQELGARPIYATDLGVGEFLLARDGGYEPAGLVLGISVYKVGWQWSNTWSGSGWGWNTTTHPSGMVTYNAGEGELTTLTEAHLNARSLALGRMWQEAKALRAHGVVGVRLTEQEKAYGGNTIEFKATGTAVRLRGIPPPDKPFLSDLTGEDFWTLLQAGYQPKGLAMGVSIYQSIGVQRATGMFGNAARSNWEITPYSDAMYRARHQAMDRIHKEMAQFGATGMVGVTTDSRWDEYETEQNKTVFVWARAHFIAIGTAIAPLPEQPASRSPGRRGTVPILNMRGLRGLRQKSRAAQLSRGAAPEFEDGEGDESRADPDGESGDDA